MAKEAAAPMRLRGESWREVLQLRPRQNAKADVERQVNGTVHVTVHIKRPKWYIPPLAWLIPVRDRKTGEISGIGLRIWEWCDGSRTLEEVIDLFAEQYRLTFHEARASVQSYLNQLMEKGILSLEKE